MANHAPAIIHIGAPKTGSTAIQNFLYDHEDDLEQLGIHYPRHGVKRGGGHVGFRQSLNNSSLKKQEGVENRESFHRILHQESCTLLSSEMLWTVPAANILKVYPEVENSKIVFFVRDQPSMVESHYTQKVKSGVMREFPREFFEKNKELYNFSRVYAQWTTAFGAENVLVISYNKAKLTGILSSFFDCIALHSFISNRERIEHLQKKIKESNFKLSNKRLRKEKVISILYVNRNVDDEHKKRDLIKRILRDSELDCLREQENLFDEELRGEIREYYLKSNSELEGRTGVDLRFY